MKKLLCLLFFCKNMPAKTGLWHVTLRHSMLWQEPSSLSECCRCYCGYCFCAPSGLSSTFCSCPACSHWSFTEAEDCPFLTGVLQMFSSKCYSEMLHCSALCQTAPPNPEDWEPHNCVHALDQVLSRHLNLTSTPPLVGCAVVTHHKILK